MLSKTRSISGLRRTLVLTLLFVAFVSIEFQFSRTSTASSSSRASTATSIKETSVARAKENYEKLPARFESNRGQTDKRAKYFVRSNGYTVFYTTSEIVLALRKPVASKAAPALGNPEQSTPAFEYSSLRMKLGGANKNPAIVGEDELPGTTNYYIGNDPKKWQTNVPAFRSVRYKQIYDGIDLVHYGNGNELEYDFIVQPAADPKRIQMEFSGIEDLRVDRDGSLVFKTLAGELRHSKPIVYQEVNGTRKEIESHFTRRGNRIGFELGAYDRNQILIIDPSLTYSTFLGGTGPDFGTSIALDANGNAYLTGNTGSLDFPQVNPARSRSGDIECFITKLNANGNGLIFSTYFGGTSTDRPYGIAVDSVGAAYVTGQTFSSDYPRTASPVQLFLRGTSDAFVTKLSQAGLLQYSTFLGGGGSSDVGYAIGIDTSGNMFVTGQTNSTDFPTQSPSQLSSGGGFDAFVTAINATGTFYLYSTYLGGNNIDSGSAIAVEFATGTAYVAGATLSTNFPVTPGVVKGTNLGSSNDAFVTKFNPGGSRNYSTYFGGVNSFDKARGIAIDSTGNAYITGHTNTFVTPSDFPAVNAVQPTTGGAFFDDGFVAKLSPTGAQTLYSTFLGGSLLDYGNSIAVDSSGNAYVVGYTASSNFPTSNPLMLVLNGNSDAFITKIGPNGNTFGFSTFLGGTTDDEATDVVLCGGNPTLCNSSSSLYVVGTTNSLSNGIPDFPTTTGAFQTVGNGTSADPFVTKINQTGVTPYITGTVSTIGGNLLPNVGMLLSGPQMKSTLTGNNGQYTFQLLPTGAYTVTPGNYNYAFNPANRPYSNLTTPQTGQNFSAVTLLNDNLANAINLTGSLGTAYYGANFGATKECTEANHAGNPATASVWYRWTAPPITQTVFVSTAGSSIDTTLDVYQGSSLNVCSLPTPVASNDDVGGDGTSRLSFVAQANTVYYIAIDSKFGTGPFKLTIDRALTISGTAQNVNGRGLPDINIGIDGDLVSTTTTNSNGDFSFTVPPGGTYTVTPSHVSVGLWTPSDRTFNNLQDNDSVTFTATTPTPSITGELKNLTLGIADVSVIVGGSGISNRTCNVTSNAGVVTYTCPNLNIRGDYEITPMSTTYTFNPSVRAFDDLQGDILQGPGSEFSGMPAPLATTLAASAVGSTTATLNGTVNPRGVATTAAFVWSTSPTFDTSTSTSFQSVGSGTTAVSYNRNIFSLAPGTTYYFYVTAQNASASANGAVLSFTTLPQVTIQTSQPGLQISIDGGPLVTAPQTVSWAPGSVHTIATTSPQAGATGTRYVFANWSDGGLISHSVLAPSVNTTYTASFNTQYLLTMSAGSGGTVAPATGFFNSGQSVQITATPTPNSGFSFGSWAGTGSGSYSGTNNPATVTMNGPITQTATFTQNTVQLSIETSPTGRTISIDGGAPVVAPQTITRNIGSSVTIATTATQEGAAGTQYVFTGWSDGGNMSHTVTVPSVNTTYTANFKTQYRLTMSAGTGGSVAPAAGFFDSGQIVQISATPVNSTFNFAGWTGTGNGSFTGSANPAMVTMNEPITEVASFTQNPVISLSAASYSVNEGSTSLIVTVNRIGNTTAPATVDYKTTDTDNFTVGCSDTVNNLGGAFARCDYATSLDTLTFAAGETSKTFQIPIINDSLDENDETFTVTLSNVTGATLGSPSAATITIQDNDTGTGANPIFTTSFFVRQQYLDFLSREPEPGEPWSGVLNNCSDVNNNPACDRVTVSASFFGSPEFQLKGYFVYRFYKLAFNRLPTYPEIVNDMRAVTGATGQEVFQKKAAFTNAFVLRTEFTNIYDDLSNANYVSTLMGRFSLTQITTPDPANPDGTNKVTLTTADLTNRLNGVGGTLTRAQVLRAIADSDQVFNAEFNAAFVAMQYFGYLRRAPDTAGFNAWQNYLNANPGDSRTMVNGFMNSAEYRLRFGPATP